MARFTLIYSHPNEGEEKFELAPERSYRIGSSPDNDVVIDQKDVSRRHAVLRVHDGGFHITDLDSKNGTFVNGAKVVSGSFSSGDMVHLSSARLVVVELGANGDSESGSAIAPDVDDPSGSSTEETGAFRSDVTMEDLITLIEATAEAVRRGRLAEPLRWAVDHRGFDGAVVLYRDEDGGIAMVASAGNLGELPVKTDVLAQLATEEMSTSAAGTRIRQVRELGENQIVASVGRDHVLVVRSTGQPPAIDDLRSLIAAVGAVLASGSFIGREGDTAAILVPPDLDRPASDVAAEDPDRDRFVLDLDSVADVGLADARNQFESWMIRRVLEACDGKQGRAAERLGLSRAGLFKKMRKLGL